MSRVLTALPVLLIVSLTLPRSVRGQIPDTSAGLPAVMSMTDSTTDSAGGYPVLLPGIGAWQGPSIAATVIPDSLYPNRERRSAVDLLRPGAAVFAHELGQGGLGRYLSADGLPAGSLVYLSDGFPLSDPSGVPFNPDIYPTEFSGSIEYAPPGTAFIRALGATGGSVNFVTREAQAIHPLSRIRYSQSIYGYSDIDGSITQDVARGLNVALGVRHPVYDGRFGNSALDAWGGRARVRYDFTDAAVYASDIFTRWEHGLNDGVSLATADSLLFDRIRAIVNNPSATEKLVRHDFRAGTTVLTDGGSARYLFEINFSSVHHEYRDDVNGLSATGPAVRETRRSQWYGFRLSHTRTVAGVPVSVGFLIQNRRIIEHPLIGSHRSLQTSFDASVELAPGSGLVIVPSARLDRYLDKLRYSFGGDATLALGALLSLRAGISHAYRYPSFGWIEGIADLVEAPSDPEPEQHDHLTAGVVAGHDPENTVSLDFFFRNIRHRLVLRPADEPAAAPFRFGKNGTENRRGGTFSASVKFGSILTEGEIDYTLFGQNFERKTTPAWDIRVGIYFRDSLVHNHLDLKAGFRGRYFTAYDGEWYSQHYGIFLPSGVRVPPAGVLDFLLVAGIGDAHVHFVWENLLDRDYITTVFYPMDDRAIRFGITWDFVD